MVKKDITGALKAIMAKGLLIAEQLGYIQFDPDQ